MLFNVGANPGECPQSFRRPVNFQRHDRSWTSPDTGTSAHYSAGFTRNLHMSNTRRRRAASHRLFSASVGLPNRAANQLDKRANANIGRPVQKLDVRDRRTKDASFGAAHEMGLLRDKDALKFDLIDHPFLL
jgi:hypothetical protein